MISLIQAVFIDFFRALYDADFASRIIFFHSLFARFTVLIAVTGAADIDLVLGSGNRRFYGLAA